MRRWAAIAASAAAHRSAARRPDIGDDAPALVDASIAAADIRVGTFSRGELFGAGVDGCAIPGTRQFLVGDWLPPDERAVVLAHELGHFHLHPDDLLQTVVTKGSSPRPTGGARGYSPQELKEQQADAFAHEFVCPSNRLRAALAAGRSAGDIATSWRVPHDVVLAQATRALLTLTDEEAGSGTARAGLVLDEAQARAVGWAGGDVVLEGGPGTGKTTALIGRILHLRARGVPAASIIATSSSERAAEAMRAAVPMEIAAQAWIGTLRSFALDVVGKWPERVGRCAGVRVLDRVGALSTLRRGARDAGEGRRAPALLRTIWLLKAHLLDAGAVALRAEDQLRRAQRDDVHRARCAADAARAFLRYENDLRDANALDAADLVPAAIRILEVDADARDHCAARFRHLLVDDVEDATHAERALIGRLADLGAELWVTGSGDAAVRSSSGASDRSLGDLRGSRLRLPRERRPSSTPLGAAERLAPSRVGTPEPRPRAGPRTTLTTAPDATGEAGAIAATIRALRESGVPYRDQVVLARAHLTLDRIAGPLRKAGIPLAHFGDLRTRPEVGDLMAVLRLDGAGLARVASLPEYAVPARDVAAFLGSARSQGLDPRTALLRLGEVPSLSAEGIQSFRRLAGDLGGLAPDAPPARVLRSWLFERGSYVRRRLGRTDGGTAEAQMTLLVIHHVLNICEEHHAVGGDHDDLIERIGTAASLWQETGFRRASPETSDLDAVRVLTVHASKGLTFKAVHWAGLSDGYQPLRFRRGTLAVPTGLVPVPTRERHDREEEALALVAVTRASHHLHLYRARTYANAQTRESPLVRRLASILDQREAPSATDEPRHADRPQYGT